MTCPVPEEELSETPLKDSPEFEPTPKVTIIKAEEIAEGWERDLEIPEGTAMDEVYRLYVSKLVYSEDLSKSGYKMISFPEDGPGIFGITINELQAIGGEGSYLIRLWDKKQRKWAGSKVIKIGISPGRPTNESRRLQNEEPEEKPKEEDDMNEFAENQITKLETRVERLEGDLRTASKEASDNKLEALEAKNDVKNLESVAKEAEKRVESEKSALDREITNLKNDVTRLTSDATRITSEYEQRLNSETKRIETDHTTKAEGLNKEILDLKDRLHKTEKEKDEIRFKAALDEVKRSGGSGENNSVMMAEILKHSFDYEGQKLKINSEERKDERDIAREIKLAEIESSIPPDEDTPDEAPTNQPPQTGGTGIGGVVESLLKGSLDPIQEWLSKVGLIVKSPEDIEALKQEYMTAGAQMAEKKITEAIEAERKKASVREEKERIAAGKKAATDKKTAAAKKKDTESPKASDQADPKDPEKEEEKE